MNLFIKWLNMLRGKPVSKDQAGTNGKSQNQQSVPDSGVDADQQKAHDYYYQGEEVEEDSVEQDLQKAQNFTKKVVEKIKKSPMPLPDIDKVIPKKASSQPQEKVTQQAAAQPQRTGSRLPNEMLGKALRIVVILALVLILIFVSLSLLRMLSGNGSENGGQQTGQVDDEPTATPVTYRPYEPSVYAKDPEILQIEEDVSVLDSELFRSNIGSPVIQPPKLDFSISFE